MNEYSRSVNSFRNVSFGYIKQLVTLVLAFATKTIFVRLLGAEYTGVSGLYSNILTVLSLAELGVGNVLVYSLYTPLLNDDKEQIRELIHYFKKIYRIIAFAVAVLGIGMIPFLKYIVNSNLSMNELITYYLLYLTNSVFSYFLVYKSTLIQADQKIFVKSIVELLFLVVQYTGQIVYLLLTQNFLGYLVIQVLCTLLQNIALNIISNKQYPYINERTSYSSKVDKVRLSENIKAMFLYKLSVVIINNTDNILISMILGTIYVGYYSNYYMLITYVSTFISLTIAGITASLGNLNAENNSNKSYAIFKNLIYIFNVITIFCVCSFGVVVQDFVPIWLGKEYVLGNDIVAAILFTFYIMNVVNPVWMYRETMGLFKRIKYVMAVTAILNIILSIILGKLWGISGIIAATGIARILTIVWYEPNILYKIKFHQKTSCYFFMQGKLLLINIIILITSLSICNLLPRTMPFIILKVVVCGCIVATFQIIVMHRSDEFKWVLGKVRYTMKKYDIHRCRRTV